MTRHHPYYRFGPIWPLKSLFFYKSYLTGPDPRAGLPLDIVWRWQLIIWKTINYSVKRTLCIPFSTTRENSRFLNYRSRLLSLKLIISFAKRFVWWSKLQNRGDGTANQMAQITIPRLQAWQKFQLEIENRIFLNDNVVLQSVSTRLTVTVRHVNKKIRLPFIKDKLISTCIRLKSSKEDKDDLHRSYRRFQNEF